MVSEDNSAKSNEAEEQRITGLYRLVTLPRFYDVFQNLLGASKARRRFFSEWVITDSKDNVLDIGCGPGVAIPYISFQHYLGIDLNPNHIAVARSRKTPNANFEVGLAQDIAPALHEEFDVVLALGFLHHLNDKNVASLIDGVLPKLRPNSSIYFLEPVYVDGQHFIARKLKDSDSGQHIRTREQYSNLMRRPGFKLTDRISNDLLYLPYNHYWGKLTRDE